MQVFHTAGEPPSSGKAILPNMGCTRNSNSALTNRVMENSGSKATSPFFKGVRERMAETRFRRPKVKVAQAANLFQPYCQAPAPGRGL